MVDYLAKNLIDEGYELLTTYLPDEESVFAGKDKSESYPRWKMFLEGEVNTIGLGIGAVLISKLEKKCPATRKYRF